MDLNRFVRIIWKWLWLIVLGTALAGGVSYEVSRSVPTFYEATTTVMIGQFIQEKNPNVNVLSTIERLAQNYADMARRRPLLQAVIGELNLSTSPGVLAGRVNVRSVGGTQLMEIRVMDAEPLQAINIANEIAKQLIANSPTEEERKREEENQFVQAQLSELQSRIEGGQQRVLELQQAIAASANAAEIADYSARIDALNRQIDIWRGNFVALRGSLGPNAINYLTVVEPATSAEPRGPNSRTNVSLAATAGALLVLLVVFVMEYVDDTLRSAGDVSRLTKLPYLGSITNCKPKREHGPSPLVCIAASDSLAAEQFRLLRSRILLSGLSNPHLSLLVTSPRSSEGKSLVAANLAVAMANSGSRTVIVDANIHAPQLHKLFGVDPGNSLDAVISGSQGDLSAALVNTAVPKLSLLTLGNETSDNRDLLTPARVTQLIGDLGSVADVVVFDAPSVLSYSYSVVLGAKARATLLVAQSNRSWARDMQKCHEVLNGAGANVIGVVLNRAREKRLFA